MLCTLKGCEVVTGEVPLWLWLTAMGVPRDAWEGTGDILFINGGGSEVVMGLLLYILEAGGGGVVPLGGVGGGLALLVLRLLGKGGGAPSPLWDGGTLGGGSTWWDLGGRAGGAPLATLGESERKFMVAGLAR